MPRYAITEKAGRFVAGNNNTGVGTVLTMTEKQAEHELRLGTLVPVDLPVAAPAAQEAEDAPKASTQRRGKKAAPEPAPAPAEAAADAPADAEGDAASEDEGDGA